MMEQAVRGRIKGSVIAAASIMAVFFVLLLAQADSAFAYPTGYHQFCWGYVEGGYGSCEALGHDGLAGYTTEVDGSGANHSVCVEAAHSDGIRMCSPGPNQGVYNFSPSGTLLSIPVISNNAAGTNTVYGAAVFCATSAGC